MERRRSRSAKKGSRASSGRVRVGRRPKPRPATERRKNLRLDQKKLDLLRRKLGLSTDQEVVERVIDEAVADRGLCDATLDLGGAFPDMVDVGGRS
jgi:hypothetical protein